MKKQILSLILFLFLGISIDAQTKVRCTGGFIVCFSGSSNLVIQNGYLDIPLQTLPAVTGVFKPGLGKLKLTGTAVVGQSFLRMDDTLNSSIYKLDIDKSLNNARLLSNLKVKNVLTLINGNLELSSRKLFFSNLATSFITNESETRRMFGTTGYAERTKTLNAPVADNPSNLGAIISASANLGSTRIRRGNFVYTMSSGTSIQRYFNIRKSGTSTETFTLRFSYFDAELNGKNENTMVLWQKVASGAWTMLGATARDVSANWVEFSGCTLAGVNESIYTLAPPTVSLAQEGSPVTVDFENEDEAEPVLNLAAGDWATYPNPAIDVINVVINAPVEKNVTLLWLDEQGRLVMTEPNELVAGENFLVSDVSELPVGTYFIHCQGLDLPPQKVVKTAD